MTPPEMTPPYACGVVNFATFAYTNGVYPGANNMRGEGMMKELFLLLSVSAICTIGYALFKVITLRKRLKGGVVGKTWTLLYYMIGLFAAGYLSTLLFAVLPEASQQVIVGIVFLISAVFVVVVINLFLKIAKELGL